jgi:hypothetical protein
MLDINKIIDIVDPHIVNAPTKRVPERIQTLGSDVELETKVNIKSTRDIMSVVEKITECRAKQNVLFLN